MSINIADTFEKIATNIPKQLAIIEAKSGRTLLFQELQSQSDMYANYFASEGVKQGDIVILMVKPSIEFLCITLALFKIGSPIVLIDPGMGYKNLLRCISRVGANTLISVPKGVLFSKIFSSHFKSIKKTFCCGQSFSVFGPDISEIELTGPKPVKVYQPQSVDLAAIIFTTGSTGPPKGVCYDHSLFHAQLNLIKKYYKIGERDIDQPAFPLFALFSAALGACSVLPDMNPTKPAQVNPKKFIDSIIKHEVTYSFGSPAIWDVVSSYCQKQKIKLHSLQKILMAGAPVPYDLLKRTRSIVAESCEIHTPYGATESLPIASIESKEVLKETWEKTEQGKGTCVGKALPGIEIKVIAISEKVIPDISSALVLNNGEMGEFIVRGAVVTKQYRNNSEETSLAKIKDGNSIWHRMGDVGYLDDKDRLWFCGRKGHRVVTKQKTLYTICCEAIINVHPDVKRSALVGITSDNSKETVGVLIVEPIKEKKLDYGILLEGVKTLAKNNNITKEIDHFLIHKSFPVDIRHNAKIFREKLALWAQTKLSV